MKQNKNTNKINTKNTPYLIIVESPSKCKKIEKILGFQYKCIASNGHFREISKINTTKNNINDGKKYEPVFEIIASKKKHVENMREIIACFSPENIFLGTDDDREGEAIAWHICMTFELSIEKVHRILFHEITEQAIKHAVQTPLKIRMNIVFAQHARQILDRLVGFQISPLLTKRITSSSSSSNQYLSAGRCQTPALRLIYDKEKKALSQQKKDTYPYQAFGSFFSQKSSANSFSFPLKFTLSHTIETKEECISFLEKSKGFNHELLLENPQQKELTPPIPFNTSSLLQAANIQLNLSPKETMMYCQQLYQNGYITYMRTENTKYSEMFLTKVREFIIEKTNSPEYIGNLIELQNQNSNSEIACPHEAIRVTNLICSNISLDLGNNEIENQHQKEQRQRLYVLIWKRSIESCMSNYIYKQIIIKITSPNEGIYYKYVLDIPVFLGYQMDILQNKMEIMKKMGEEQMKKNALYLFLQCAKSPIKCMKIECENIISEKNSHYTEAGLIRDLEEYGIGRPSTFSIILQSIQERNYVVKKNLEGIKIKCIDLVLDLDIKKDIEEIEKERIMGKEKNKLVLQELGKTVIEELIPTFNDLFSYDYTKKMEIELDKISKDQDQEKEEWNIICNECENTIKKNAKQWKIEMKQNYKIDDDHELIFIKTGAIILYKNSEYKSIRSNIKIDFNKLRNKEYNLEELLEIPNDYLGEYEGFPLFMKKGPYGIYVTWGEKKESIHLEKFEKNKKLEKITLEDIIQYLQMKHTHHISEKKNVLRVLNERISIRKGKYGAYIYYNIPNSKEKEKEKEKEKKKDPHFYNLKLFPGNYSICETKEILEWLENTYGII